MIESVTYLPPHTQWVLRLECFGLQDAIQIDQARILPDYTY